MKGNTKGFTLVELLAVIVILAIIALITIPAILNVINEAREKGAEDKAWGVIDGVRLAFTQEQGLGEGTITATSGTHVVCFGTTKGEGCSDEEYVGSKPVVLSGDKPKSGKVIIDLETGTITCKDLVFTNNGNYKCSSNDGNKMTCTPQ